MSMRRHEFDSSTRVSAESELSNYPSKRVVVRKNLNAEWELSLEPDMARRLARRLKAAADYLDPPKRRTR